MSDQRTYLVTGALGCIGAWTLYHLVRQGERVVSFDLADQGPRLDLLMTAEEKAKITFVRGDLADFAQVLDVFKGYGITHVVHLAALQVPFCRANPVVGAQVNVVGTVNIFEAAKQSGLKHLAYASSIAVYGPPNLYPVGPIQHDAPFAPTTLYGVYKQADEGLARVYWQEYQISSTALRPYTVYGVGRDQGLTSDPTKAMLATAAGQPFTISFGGTTQFQLASDVALQFIEAARQPLNGASGAGAYGFNMGGRPTTTAQFAEIIRQVRPSAKIAVTENRLPFPDSFDDSELRKRFSTVFDTPLMDGIRQTIEHFETCLSDGRIAVPEKS